MSRERILLTGATGHLGKALAGRLCTSGYQVVGIGRRASALTALEQEVGDRFTGVRCDLTQERDIGSVVRAHGPFTALVHAAAAIDIGLSPREIYMQNVYTTGALLEKLRGQVGRVVYVSSIDTYGMPQSSPITEDHPTRPSTFYGASKLAGEEYVRLFGQACGVKTAMLRVSSIYGPGEWLNRAMLAFLKASIAGEPIVLMGDGADLRDYVFVTDVAEGVLGVVRNEVEGVYNLGGGAPVSIRELARTAQELTNSSAGLQERERVKPRYDLFLDIGKLSRATGFRPRVSLREGMAQELASMQNPTA
jgi:UDP-glucose 4-epimerase